MSSETTPPAPRRRRSWVFTLLLLASLSVNALAVGAAWWWFSDSEESPAEGYLYGSRKANDKVAVIRADGPLIEGLNGYILQQIDRVSKDDSVKAVVLRINSPGGTIGASEDLHRELTRMVQGKHPRHPDNKPKKLVASMGAIAASGGYYIAMPAERIFAERTCITGSIGVYAALPNVSAFAKEHGIRLELIKAGGIKGAGSPLHELTPAEREPWQTMVDHAYVQFLDVVANGRPALTVARLKDEVVSRKSVPLRDDKGNIIKDMAGQPKLVEVIRTRTDGGTFTPEEAKQYGLVDDIGTLEEAVAAAAATAGLSDYKVVVYSRPTSFLADLIGLKAQTRPGLDLSSIAEGLSPRLWYLAPQSELSGLLAVSGSR